MQATDRLDTRILNKRHPPGVEWVFEQVIQRLTRERLTLWCTEAFFGKDRQYLGLLLAKACRSQFEGAPNKARRTRGAYSSGLMLGPPLALMLT